MCFDCPKLGLPKYSAKTKKSNLQAYIVVEYPNGLYNNNKWKIYWIFEIFELTLQKHIFSTIQNLHTHCFMLINYCLLLTIYTLQGTYAIIINVHIMLSIYINLKKKAVAELFSRKSTLFKKWIKLFPYAGSSLILLHPGQ